MRASITEEQDFEDSSENAISMDLDVTHVFSQPKSALPTAGA